MGFFVLKNGEVTAPHCKCGLKKNCRNGLPVGGFESHPPHRRYGMQSGQSDQTFTLDIERCVRVRAPSVVQILVVG